MDAADGGAQPRAADHRRAGARAWPSGRSTTCSAYVKERKQFGKPIGSFQALRHRLADLATEIEATRLLVYDTAARVDANPGALFPREASMCKLKATETAKHATLEGVQMMGGYGYATEYDMERQLRTAIVTTIYGGTSEIQRDIISQDARAVTPTRLATSATAGAEAGRLPGATRSGRTGDRRVALLVGTAVLGQRRSLGGRTTAPVRPSESNARSKRSGPTNEPTMPTPYRRGR